MPDIVNGRLKLTPVCSLLGFISTSEVGNNKGTSFIDTIGTSSFLEFISNPPYFNTNSLNFLSCESSLFKDIFGVGKLSLLVPPPKLVFKALAMSILNISSLAPEIIMLASVFKID